jgi:predicted unusual protein kinase regulating ubiquinone biosynthesis (AarF/ABC1/UbiB family)
VAVKVQYPGAAEALVADLGNLDHLTPLLRMAAPGLDARQLFGELRTRLIEEVDYVLEADAQTAFSDAFRGDADIAVPEVLAVEDRVLVSRWMEGTPLSQVIAGGPQEQRDRCGLLLLRLLLSSPSRAGRLHGDPHPGNFRLLPDGRLGVLDFGSTEAMPSGWPPRLGTLLVALRDEHAAGLHEVARSAGLLDGDRVGADALLDLLGAYGAPLREPVHHFERSWLSGQVRRTSDPRSAASRAQRHLTVPASHLLVQRVAVGLAGVLVSLGARVPVDAEVRRWVPGYA